MVTSLAVQRARFTELFFDIVSLYVIHTVTIDRSWARKLLFFVNIIHAIGVLVRPDNRFISSFSTCLFSLANVYVSNVTSGLMPSRDSWSLFTTANIITIGMFCTIRFAVSYNDLLPINYLPAFVGSLAGAIVFVFFISVAQRQEFPPVDAFQGHNYNHGRHTFVCVLFTIAMLVCGLLPVIHTRFGTHFRPSTYALWNSAARLILLVAASI